MLELSLVTSSLKVIDSLLTPKAVVDEKEKAIKSIKTSIENKFTLEEKDLKAIEKTLRAGKLKESDKVKKAPIDPEFEAKEREASLKLINLLLNQANFKVASKIADEYASKVDFASGNVDLEYLKGLLVAKEKYLKTKAAK